MMEVVTAELSEEAVLRRLRGLVTYERRQADIAAAAGVSVAFLSAVLLGKKKPSPRLLSLIGVERVTLYREAK